MALITQTSPLIGSARDKGGSVSSDLMFLQAGARCKLRVFLSRFRSPYNHVHTPSLYSASCSLHSSNLGTKMMLLFQLFVTGSSTAVGRFHCHSNQSGDEQEWNTFRLSEVSGEHFVGANTFLVKKEGIYFQGFEQIQCEVIQESPEW